jgi:diaminopropionate ammonia-lyase
MPSPKLTANTRAVRAPYPADLRHIMSIEQARQSFAWLRRWDGISAAATPLYQLPGLAAQLQVASIVLKDESVRSPLASFKALGAPIALARLILRLYPDQMFEPGTLFTGRYAGRLHDLTVISATDGNHGRALAAAAHAIGCRCVIVLHAGVSAEREQAIAAYGARIIRIAGNYDASVDEAAKLADSNQWTVVSDTSYEGYEDIPRDVMQGYGAIAEEIVALPPLGAKQTTGFSHVFLQGGVGGLAAGVASYLWELYGADRPRCVIVEPAQADCLYQSALAGHAAEASGSVDSVMAGLACGKTSPLAWRFLEPCIDHFLTISDDDAVAAMKALAIGGVQDVPIVSGESGAAGVAGLSVARGDATLSAQLGLDVNSRILCLNTEGATAPSVYRELVGEAAESVLIRQRAWLGQAEPKVTR